MSATGELPAPSDRVYHDDWPMSSLADERMLRQPPVTARGIRTRASLVAAARTVFERDGFLDTRLADIATEAGCAIGTFYTYFASKEEIFHAVLDDVREEMLHPRVHLRPADDAARPDAATAYAVIASGNRAYLESYQRNAKLMRLLEQVATIDPRFRAIRTRRAEAFFERNARSIAELQAEGLVDADLDPLLTAMALSAMVSRVAYHVFCCAEDTTPRVDELVDTCTRLWANALGLDRPR